ncbi:unnamed protein product [Urochloa humidicola]
MPALHPAASSGIWIFPPLVYYLSSCPGRPSLPARVRGLGNTGNVQLQGNGCIDAIWCSVEFEVVSAAQLRVAFSSKEIDALLSAARKWMHWCYMMLGGV